jgi:hypothetical protein
VPLCDPHAVIVTADSFFGKLVGKSEARGKSFSLFCCGPQQAGQSPKADVDKDLHMWTKVPRIRVGTRCLQMVTVQNMCLQIKWKSVAKVPEPRRIKVRLSEQTRMLRNFCAEKRTMATKLALFDNPVTSRKNFVLMWESQPGVVGGDAVRVAPLVLQFRAALSTVSALRLDQGKRYIISVAA